MRWRERSGMVNTAERGITGGEGGKRGGIADEGKEKRKRRRKRKWRRKKRERGEGDGGE